MSATTAEPEAALRQLSKRLRREDTVISPHVIEPGEQPVLGPLAAAGARAARARGEYSLVLEAVREGYLLHYGSPRILAGHDENLALLAGDYLYALGLERLASMGDGEAVHELSDLISLCAAAHAEQAAALTPALWLAAAVAIGSGRGEGHENAKARARELRPDAAPALLEAARARASVTGITHRFERAAEAIDLRLPRHA
jgi:hypothetical protein